MSDRHYRRTEGGERFSHNTVAVLEAFATAVLGLHEALEDARWGDPKYAEHWANRAAEWTRSAVRAARMLAVREDYR